MTQDQRVPPQIDQLLEYLQRHEVRYVVFGSGGAWLHGADIANGDFDICPALDKANLRRLGKMLTAINARPRVIPGWMTADQSAAWSVDFLTEENFDHLFDTSLGDLDLVPRPYGPDGAADRFDFVSLNERAVTLNAFGRLVRVAGIDDLVASKMSRRRPKDVDALAELERLRRRTER